MRTLRIAASLLLSTLLTACGGKSTPSEPAPQQQVQVRVNQKQAGTGLTASDYANVVQELYVAYFGRPADPNGLIGFENALLAAGAPDDLPDLNTAYKTNAAVRALVDSFQTSAESKAFYGSGDATAFVTSVFQNVLGRQPASSGLNFWVGQISSGSLTQGDAALAIMEGGLTNTTAQGKTDTALINNRLAVATYFTAQVSSSGATSGYVGASAAGAARTLLANVNQNTDTSAYRATANAVIAGFGGSASGGVAAVSGTPAGSAIGISFGTTTFTLPTKPGLSVTTTLTAQPTSGSTEFANVSAVCATVTDNTGVFSSNVQVDYNPDSNFVFATLTVPSTVPAGRHQGNIALNLYGDSQCKTPLPGSPWVFAYDVAATTTYFAKSVGLPATSSSGMFYIVDQGDSAIISVNASNMSSTIPVTFGPYGIAVNAAGTVYFNDYTAIWQISPNGTPSLLAGGTTQNSVDGTGTAASFISPEGMAVDAAGNIIIAEFDSCTIRKVTSSGVASTFAGSRIVPAGSVDGNCGYVDGPVASARFQTPGAVAIDAAGTVYVVDTGNSAIRKISGGNVTTLAGGATMGSADGTGTAASFSYPQGIAIDSTGNLYVAEPRSHIVRKITQAGVVSTVAGSPGNSGYANGNGAASRFNGPSGIAVDSQDNIYVVDAGNHVIRVISSAGEVSTLITIAK